MAGWETIVAAVGGIALGAGLALSWRRRRLRSLKRELHALRAELRRSVIPVLERRAVELAIPRDARRSQEPEDPTAVAITLAEEIRAIEERHSLPFSDTLNVSQDLMERRARVSSSEGSEEEE